MAERCNTHLEVDAVVLEQHTMSVLHSWGAEISQVFSVAAQDHISYSYTLILQHSKETTCPYADCNFVPELHISLSYIRTHLS